jgi:hypothetical protein
MPHYVRHGQWLEPTLALTASDHREYTAQIRLWTDRLESSRPQERPVFIKTRLDPRSALQSWLAISTVWSTLRNREIWRWTRTGESRSESADF